MGKKKLDLDTIQLKLKFKVYLDIYEFLDDVFKMLKNASDSMLRSKSISNYY